MEFYAAINEDVVGEYLIKKNTLQYVIKRLNCKIYVNHEPNFITYEYIYIHIYIYIYKYVYICIYIIHLGVRGGLKLYTTKKLTEVSLVLGI